MLLCCVWLISCDSAATTPGEYREHGTDRKMYEDMAKLCGLPSFKQRITQKDFAGAALTNAEGKKAIDALKAPNDNTILTVPVDSREYCQKVFKNIFRIQDRRSLLCTAAFPGSGKTVLLGFNAQWFVEETKGISVMVTFNSDQANMLKGCDVASKRDFEEAIAARILRRVIGHFKLPRDNIFMDAEVIDIMAGDMVNHSTVPLKDALNVLRWCLGAPDSTPVLLCVDELAKCITVKSNSFTDEKALGVLTSRLDVDSLFYLSVSALNTEAIVNLSTGSNRALLLQTLEPLWFSHGFNPSQYHLLPVALQPFYDESIRVLMPFYDEASLALYDRLTDLLVLAAGHPRRMQNLLVDLAQFQLNSTTIGKMKKSKDGKECADFVKELIHWFSFTDIKSLMELNATFPSNFTMLVPSELRKNLKGNELRIQIIDAIEEFALHTAQPFVMPREREAVAEVQTILNGLARGYCQFVQTVNGAAKLLVLIPWPVLSMYEKSKLYPELRPRGQALFLLRDAILGMHEHKRRNDTRHGKDLENVAAMSILLFARCNERFTLSQLCDPKSCGENLQDELMGGKVELLEVKNIPSKAHQISVIKNVLDKKSWKKMSGRDFQKYVAMLEASNDVNGYVIMVTDNFNIPGDLYCNPNKDA